MWHVRTQNLSGEPRASDAVGTICVLSCPPEITMGWTRQQNAFLSFASHVPVFLDRLKKPQQRPQFNYGHGLL
jgi:hypothetical protein